MLLRLLRFALLLCAPILAFVVLRGWPAWAQPIWISSAVPLDVRGDSSALSVFSWQCFVALNWPAREATRGEPDEVRPLAAAGTRVWETWKEKHEVYAHDGRQPPPWQATVPLANVPPGLKLLARNQAIQDVAEFAQADQADGRMPAILTDQSGHEVRYEIRMNRKVFDYIIDHRLHDGRMQADTSSVSYPDGACLVKAAWKEMEPSEESRYLTADCWIPGRRGRRQRMGLVGFHIMIKTPSSPQWIWATFEHTDNLAGPHPSFFNPSRPQLPDNRQTRSGNPTQVRREIPIPAWLRSLNVDMQQALARHGSVLQYYELIGTQRPFSDNANEPATVFDVSPPFLANSTQETFIQRSSCVGCHAMARTLNSRFVSGDFTFTLLNAWPRPANLTVRPAPTKPTDQWDRDLWSQIKRGEMLSNRTYELLPGHCGARLHCASCHLAAGRNPTAAWWVGMVQAYDFPATDRLQKRINQCFSRSMNGRPLSLKSADMASLVAYIRWIDRKGRGSNPPRGFPHISSGLGNARRGAAIYHQKCTFCHAADGQGRYLGGVYFRPNLWGTHSFAATAGLAKRQSTLASFIKANMPFGSGGLLTSQEAWDLAAFIETHNRPLK